MFLCCAPPNLAQPNQNEENFEMSKACKHILNILLYLILELIPSTDDKDMLNRQKLSIVIKVFIACILLAFAIPYIVFVIYEIPCPVSF